MRLIDADAMRQNWLENGENEYVYDTNAVLDSIDAQPTVDAVPVVRCKDCEHYDNSEGICWCHLNSKFYPGGADWHSFPEDGFCSYGERRTDNERKAD